MNDEVNEVEVEEEVDNIRPAFDAAVAEGQDEDNIKMAMIQAGASFKSVTRVYNAYMVDAGFAVSKDEKAEIVAKAVEGKDLSTEEGFGKVVAAIVKKAAGVTDKSAAALIRAWAKAQETEIEVYAKPKSSGAARSGFKSRFYDALVANPAMTKEEVTEYLKTAEGHSDNIRRHESVYQAVRAMANAIAVNKAAIAA